MPLSGFHPIIGDWFARRFGKPTDVQIQSWPAIREGHDVLIAAPTGSGKTLAAFLSCIDALFRQAIAGELEDRTRILYVSPLKALSNDVQKNLQQPLAEISEAAMAAGLLLPEIRATVRTGDTPVWDRQQMLRRPPHILITTPESLFILLTAEKSRRVLADVRTVIVDEIHAVAPNKRGAHLALSLERLETLAGERVTRIGLSATQRPIELIADYLVGARPRCRVIDVGHRRAMDLTVEAPKDELGPVATNAIWADIYDRLAEQVRAHRSTLVFANTRRLVERISHHLMERLADLGPRAVAAHHGSLSRHIRLSAEERLKKGETRVVVATASLELGIDIGAVDLVCQIGSPRSIAIGLQRVGRSGHWVGAVPKGRLFATTRDELLECAALIRAIRRGVLDRVEIPEAPLDILAQHVVAASAPEAWREQDLFALCRRAYPYRNLSRADFDAVLHMLGDGISTRRSRAAAYLHHDRINHRVRGRRGARLAAITSGGAIPDTANYTVIAEPDGTVVGSVDEDFAVESLAGDIILLGNASWRIRGVETGKVRVEDAHGAPPTIPFWRGEAPSRTPELSAEVGALRDEIARRLADRDAPVLPWLEQECALDQRGAEQAIAYVLAGRAILGAVPTQETIIAERFFDEAGGMQLVVHAPYGGRITRAWGLALRKRFCVTFDFELQAAATDEGLVLSLGEQHSFPLETIFSFLSSETVREVLIPAVLQAPMFMSRWRWNASRALALLRFTNGRRVPPQIQRMRSEDLLAAVFPAATACQDNHHGAPMCEQIPDHPLVRETFRDCLTEAMDVDGLIAVLRRIEAGEIRCIAIDTPAPSPFCHEILNANPYAYLDDAPLEERRARAVEMRRSLSPDMAGELGALDPAAIAEVGREAWPVVRDADELHDALLTLVRVPAERGDAWEPYLPALLAAGRAKIVDEQVWVAAERHELVSDATRREEAVRAIVQGWMESTGPATAAELAAIVRLPESEVASAMLALESQGQLLRGSFRPAAHDSRLTTHEFCDRRLLARIHRLTIGRLRKEVEPVPASLFMRFLFQWQHVAPGARQHGEHGLMEVIRQLAGFEAPAAAWEPALLAIRMAKYDPALLDRACLSGNVAWGRLTPHPRLTVELPLKDASSEGERRRIVPTSAAPVSVFPRDEAEWLLDIFRDEAGTPRPADEALTAVAQDVRRALAARGALFFSEMVRATGRLPSEIEQALWELVAAGLVTSDSFDNLRALTDPRRRRGESRERQRRPRHGAGRWSLLRPQNPSPLSLPQGERGEQRERIARLLLRRYGVVFRDLLARDPMCMAWRDLLVAYRRMELRGEIRGGRFVSGFVGEQFALPEAVEALRAFRKAPPPAWAGQEIRISGADPLNLVGVILPGERVPAVQSTFVVFRDGVPVRWGRYRDATAGQSRTRSSAATSSAGVVETDGTSDP